MKNRIHWGGLGLLLCGALVACPTPPSGNTKVTVQAATTNFQVAIKTKATFYATIDNTSDQRVTWSIDNASPDKGSIDQKGEYTAPDSVPTPDTVNIRATSVADPSQSGFLPIKIVLQGGLSGSITLPANLVSAPNNATTLAATNQPARGRSFTPDWSAPRSRGVLLVVPSDAARVQTLAAASSLKGLRTEAVDGALRVFVPAGVDEKAFAAKLEAETGAFVQPNYRYSSLDLPNDPDYVKQSNLTQIDAPGGWAVQTSVPDGLIAVLDTGIKKDHPDVAGRVIYGKDFCPTYSGNACSGEDDDPSDFTAVGGGHGTFATGMIAATTNNNTQIAGITQSGKVLAVKVFGFDAQGAVADTVALSKGIRYAVDQGAKVLSMSLGVCANQKDAFDTPDKLTANAIAYAASKGAVMVAAAGNNGAGAGCSNTNIQFPGNDPNVIAVGSVNGSNARSSFSAVGPELDIVAPGEGILSLGMNNGLVTEDGTSFAAPQVAAVAGLMIAKNPSLNRDQVKGILESTAKDLGAGGRDNDFGFGLLQTGAALRKAANPNGPAQAATTIYVYADRYKTSCGNPNSGACYDGNDPQSGRSVVTLNGTQGSVNFSVTINRSGQPLQPGTYRVVACVNKNSNATACDSGDLGGVSQLNINYSGNTVTGINITLGQL